jgi:hypothetical protein
MMSSIAINTLDDALNLFQRVRSGENFEAFENISIGTWVNTEVKLEMGLHSEITPPFMEAFLETQNAIYRLAALVKYGAADIRHLTQGDLDTFQILVKVEDGSSEILGKIGESIGKIGEAAVDKLSPRQIILLVCVLGILVAGPVGFNTYLEHRKTVRVAELAHQEKIKTLESAEFANKNTVDLAKEVIAFAKSEGGASAKAVETAGTVNAALLRAAAETPQSIIAGNHLTRSEAKELKASARRQVNRMIVEREMRVVDINTSDPAQTTIIVEDADGTAQHRLVFADRLIQERDIEKLFMSLRSRETIWLRMDVKEVGGEVRVVDIRGVVSPPTDTSEVIATLEH